MRELRVDERLLVMTTVILAMLDLMGATAVRGERLVVSLTSPQVRIDKTTPSKAISIRLGSLGRR